MTSGVSYEILDLRHFTAAMLRPVLEAEERVWRERLHWDYHASARLLMQYLDNHMLPGYAALDHPSDQGPSDRGRVAAYSFCVYEDTKAVVGDVFANPDLAADPSPAEIEETLLRHLLETLQNSPHVDRVESQLLLHPSGSHSRAFRENGFQLFRRLFMVHPLNPDTVPQQRIDLPPCLPHGLDLHPWRDDDLTAASRLICQCYAGHPDSFINDQYNTQQGSLRFLHNIVRYSGCGIFSPSASHLVTDRLTREPVALLLGSRVSATSGHITQLCVRPQNRRQGLGQALLNIAAQSFLRQGMTEISLTVTESNASAIDLYRREGYTVAHTFDAAVWERP